MNKCDVGLTVDRARQLLTYDAEMGALYWLVTRRGGVAAGDRFGKLGKNGYRIGRVDQKYYLEHRLIWFVVHGEWPPQVIDHINRVRNDNRLSNLRLASQSQNMANSDRKRESGRRGVTWSKRCGKWLAYIQADKRYRYLGLFSSIEEAGAARDAAARTFHGEFAFIKGEQP